MAFAQTALTAAEAAALAQDKPMLVSPNRALRTHTMAWKSGSTATWAAGSDVVDAAFPLSRVCDDLTHLTSKPNALGADYTILFDFGASGISFDVIAMINQFVPGGATVVTVDISDATDFSSPTTLATTSSTTVGRRIVFLTAQRVSSARYVRIRLAMSGSTFPQAGEIIFGSRVQLDWRPDVPYDDRELLSPSVRRTTTVTGITNVVSLGNHGARRLNATLNVDSPTVQANLYTWWLEHRGTRPFLWIDNPLTAPHRACLMHQREAAFFNPWTEALNREFRLEADEQGPHYAALEP